MLLSLDMGHRMVIALLLFFLHYSSAFWMTDAEPSVIRVAPGDTVTLFCAVDDDYEWCKFYHPSGSFCDFEWKRSTGNITRQTCGLSDRVRFHGKYDDRECGITFTATEEDTGIWKCEIEEYVIWRTRGAGRVETAQMNVTVHTPTTQATVETTSPTVTASLSTEVPTSSTISPTQNTEPMNTTLVHTPTKDPGETLPYETPGLDPQVDDNKDTPDSDSSSVVLGVVVVFTILTVGISGIFYYRMRKRRSTATVVYDREANMNHDQTSLVRNSNTNISFHSNSEDTSTLHEYFPPHLT
eukprot:GFUD01037099.1.p1 GENE.GFUD01037099.1~~GFUD01037099.1.p1  ORF type:complete len:298 (-),score=78.20 GFUD01037099.1:15-908(-)